MASGVEIGAGHLAALNRFALLHNFFYFIPWLTLLKFKALG